MDLLARRLRCWLKLPFLLPQREAFAVQDPQAFIAQVPCRDSPPAKQL